MSSFIFYRNTRERKIVLAEFGIGEKKRKEWEKGKEKRKKRGKKEEKKRKFIKIIIKKNSKK